MERTENIGTESPLDVCHRGIDDACRRPREHGGVDQPGNTAECLCGGVEGTLDGGFIADVSREGSRATARSFDLSDHSCRGLDARFVKERHTLASGRSSACDFRTDAASAAADDQCTLVHDK